MRRAPRAMIRVVAPLLILAIGRLAIADSAMVAEVAERSPAWLLEIPDSVTDILIAETESATMRRFIKNW